MWGTRRRRPADVRRRRFIPTHVGNTSITSTWCAWCSVHPHACGEHKGYGGQSLSEFGSSPRMWGTHPFTRDDDGLCRFIPTHVGNTGSRSGWSGLLAVHPHACGEHRCFGWGCLLVIGSSPRMWGTQHKSPNLKGKCRFIPTHVGNTSRNSTPGCGTPVHPHACGEHQALYAPTMTCSGSSPRMWGTHNMSYIFHLHTRFIPTHVGNTFC